jgi:hypothetical protein
MRKVASAAPKARKRATKAQLKAAQEKFDADRAEVTAILEAVPEWVGALVQPLHALLVAGPKAVRATTSYNAKVLGLITRGLTRVERVPSLMSLIHANMAEIVAPLVGAFASEHVSEEQAMKRRNAAAKKMADAAGPFWRLCRIIEIDGAAGITSLLEQVTSKNASLGRLNTWTVDRLNALVFDPSRAATQCSYTLRDGVEVSFSIGDATIAWDHYQSELAHTKLLHEEHSKEWSAARRQYRIENPAGMPDGRSKKQVSDDEVRTNRAIVLAMTDDERAEISARLLSEAVT